MSRLNRTLAIMIALPVMIAGCSSNDGVRLRYEAERKLYRAEKTLSAAQMSGSASGGLIDQARSELADVAEFCLRAVDSLSPQTYPVEYRELQQIAFQATGELNALLYAQRRFDESIAVLEALLDEASLAPEELMVARLNLGRSLQASGRWDSALAVYNYTLETYYPPLSSRGELITPLFNLPVHIFDVVTRVGDSVQAAYELERAITYYSELAEKYPATQIQASSRTSLAQLYDRTGQWEKEVAQWEALSDPKSMAYPAVRMKVADLYGLKLRQFGRAIAMYDTLLTMVKPLDTSLYPEILFKKALVRMEQKQFSAARDILTDLKRDFRPYFAMNPPVQLALARTFELEQNWDRAEVEYTALIEGYRGSDEAMGALLYVANRYEKVGQKDQAQRWYRDAEEYYEAVSRSNIGGLLDAKAMSFRAELAARLGNWAESARLLEELYRKFSGHEVGRQAILRAAMIYRDELNNPDMADSLLREFRASLTEIQTSPEL